MLTSWIPEADRCGCRRFVTGAAWAGFENSFGLRRGAENRGAKESISVCPFCSCGCNFLVHVKDGKIVSTEGDPDYPVSEGALCAKGAAMFTMHVGEHRIEKPLYRAPHSDKWEEKDWDWMLDRIARRIKDTRDKYFIEKTRRDRW